MTILTALVVATAAATCPAEAVEQTAAQIERAIVAKDRAALERLIHPAFVMIHASGMKEGRDAWLRVVDEGRLSRQTAERSEYQLTLTRSGDVAIRSAVVRFRNPGKREDLWLRGTMFLRCDAGSWRQFFHQSSMLSVGPVVEAERLEDYGGDWQLPDGRTFRLGVRDRLLTLTWGNGAELVLVPLGPDRFANGGDIEMRFLRGADGRVTAVTRGDGTAIWWTAKRR